VEWVLARSRYRFKRFDLTQIPRANRAAALDLQLRQWAPYPQNGYYVCWNNGLADVFCWNADLVGQAMADRSLRPGRARVIPETVLRPRFAMGAKIIAGLHGYEGQVWGNGQLLQSRWWKELPTAGAWLAFQRDAGISPETQQQDVPAPLRLDWLDKPWGGGAGVKEMLGGGWRDERVAYFVLALLLAPATSWYAAQLHHYRESGERLRADLSALQQDAGSLAAARGEALQSLARIQQLRALDPYPHQLELMAWIAERLVRKGDRLTEWNFQNGKLKITLSTEAEIQSSALVDSLQSSRLFGNVRSSPGKNPKNITLEMDVLDLNAAISPDRG
jgi:hypothetical protein